MGNPDENPPPPETAPGTADQPNSQSQFNDLSNEIVEPGLTPGELRKYICDQLVEKVNAAFTNSRFNITDRNSYTWNINNQQNEFLFLIQLYGGPVDGHEEAYMIFSKYDIEQVFSIFPQASETDLKKSDQYYVRIAAEKVAQAALKQAESADAAIQKEKSEPDKYIRDQLDEKLDTAIKTDRGLMSPRFRLSGGTHWHPSYSYECHIQNQQGEHLTEISIVDHAYITVSGRPTYNIADQEFRIPQSEDGKREAAEKAAQATLKQAELIDAAIQKAKLDKKP